GLFVGEGTIVNSGTIAGAVAGVELTSGTVVNSGAITAASYGGDPPRGIGIGIYGNGFVTNTGPGYIRGLRDGVLIHGGFGTIVNSGTIKAIGASGYGAALSAGTVNNAAGGRIEGGLSGVFVQ